MVPLGDIDLQHEIRFNNGTGVVDRQYERQAVRRVYSARLGGQNTTVAIYQGPGAEEEWQQDIAKYMSVRHPNVLQIRGAANYGGLRATLFHDDLILFKHFVDLQPCHFSKVHTYAYCIEDFRAARDYLDFTFRQWLCTLWIRRSSSRLCVDLIQVNSDLIPLDILRTRTQGMYSSNAPNTEAKIIESLTLEEYHHICHWFLGHVRFVRTSTPTALNLGTVICCPSKNWPEDSVEIAWLPNRKSYSGSWNTPPGVAIQITEDCWIRLNSSDVLNTIVSLLIFVHPQSWLSQAYHIFSCLQITSNFDDYALIYTIRFEIAISASEEETPAGFLFLCPKEDFNVGPFSFKWPECPAYWSLDPTGAERLNAEEATELRFPSFQLSTEIRTVTWDASVYAGLRQFHTAKGFDPDSQDVARDLGLPLYQLSNEVDVPFAHVGDKDLCAKEGDEDEFSMDLSW
ncbi:hypothetical protein B0H19DRAFT_533185 [Mycena capillaripes]|nr:hypothetical protein B0H19DRAFT_533185 [Mycena capillaripes]